MKTAIKIKLLIGTLAALAAVGAVVVHHKEQARKEQIAAQLKRYEEQSRRADAEYQQQVEYEKLRKEVEAKKKKSQAYAGNESKTWTKTY